MKTPTASWSGLRRRRRPRLTQFLAAVVGILVERPHIGGTSSAALTGYVWAAVATAGFVRVESRRPEPLMDLRLFRRPVISGAVVGAVAVFIALNMTLLLDTSSACSTPGSGRHLPRAWRPCRSPLAARRRPPAAEANVFALWSGRLVARTGPGRRRERGRPAPRWRTGHGRRRPGQGLGAADSLGQFRVELGADQKGQVGQPQPDQEHDDARQ
ncbi:hypothetical protein ABT189_17095 [Streptomyces sp900105755]|uniref:hypothetical protein n=1 Tax=Streptomyces sp. 900105755 TaxID=3154389 RepID=UPI00332A0C0A